MTNPYDPSTPLRADVTDEQIYQRWSITVNSLAHMVREFAAACVAEKDARIKVLQEQQTAAEIIIEKLRFQVAAAVSRCLAIADEEAATYNDNLRAALKTGSDAGAGNAIGSRSTAERIAERIRREVRDASP